MEVSSFLSWVDGGGEEEGRRGVSIWMKEAVRVERWGMMLGGRGVDVPGSESWAVLGRKDSMISERFC